MQHAAITAIEYYLPPQTLSNADLVREFPDWTEDKIVSKTGIENRCLAGAEQYASDLAVTAAERLFARNVCARQDVDFILLCTQSPDYLLPTTACLVQSRLGLPTGIGALDINLGCSGYVYGLSLAKGLIETGQAQNVLLITAETYSKHMDPADFSVRAIFGDGAAATLVQAQAAAPEGGPWLGPFVFGTDGRGESRLISWRGGMRPPPAPSPGEDRPARPDPTALSMNGPELFTFTLRVVPECVSALLGRAGLTLPAVDQFVFHQANQFMLEHLRKKLGVPAERFAYALRDCGNTVSATIPIALHRMAAEGRLPAHARVMLVGFGVGYSWGATLLRWRSA